MDFTSGLAEMILLKEGYREEAKKNQLRKTLLRDHEEHALMCCAISVNISFYALNIPFVTVQSLIHKEAEVIS